MLERVSSTPPRSRPQVFATSRRFPGTSELAALFRAAAVPGFASPFRASPGRNRCTPLGAACSLAVIPARLRAPSRPCHSGSHRRPPRSPGALAGIPPQLWVPFQRASHGQARLPVTLDRARRAHARPRGSSASKPRSSCEVRATDPAGFPAGVAVLSWDSAPPEPSPPAPRNLIHPPRPRSAAPPAPACAETGRDLGDLTTPASGEPGQQPVKTPGQARRRTPIQCGPGRATSRRRSFSHGLGPARRRPRARPDPRSIVVSGQRHLLRGAEAPALLGFSTSSTTSLLRGRASPGS
jgi:hypothetical protein